MNGRGRAHLALLVLAAVPLASGCATLRQTDPFERVNRPIFAFNDGIDRAVLRPAAVGWNWLAPDLVQRSVANFFGNLDMPKVLVNDLLVLRVGDALEDFTRLLVNSTVGVAGFIDVAGWAGLPRNDADLGLTLGRWGVPPGPYLVVPVLGPFSTRDGVGYIGDVFMYPHVYFVPFWTTFVTYTVRSVNFRAMADEEIEEARREAVDYYVFVRNAYLQNRAARVRGIEQAPAEDQDLYWSEGDDAGPGTFP